MEVKYVKHVANPVESPWLDWIAEGRKTYEGRLRKGDWTKVDVGDHIRFEDGDKLTVVEVIEIISYTSFGVAFNDLGASLVPIPDITREDVVNLYRKYFSDEDVRRYGVVAVGVRVVK